MIIIQGPVLAKLSKIFSEAFLIITGNLIMGTNFILLTQNRIELIYLAAILFALGNGLMWPSMLTVLSRVAGKRLQGSVQGFAASAGSMASIFGLILGGFLYGAIAELTFLISAVILYLIFILSFGLVRLRISEKNS
jgi:MFS family permease